MSEESGSSESATILIAEDSPTQAEYLAYILEQHKFSIIAARDGETALALAREKKPSIIISDVMMPVMDGYQLCRAIKSDPELKGIPVVLVTELSSPNDVFKGLDAGADNFLVKPYEETALISRIGYLFANLALRNSSAPQAGIEIELSGQRHLITAERQQILDLLISTYHQAIVLYSRLEARQKELSRSYETLNALYGFADGLNRCYNEADVASVAVKRGLQIPGVRAGWMYLCDADAFRHIGPDAPISARAAPCDESCTCQRMLLAGELGAATNIARCERLVDAPEHPIHASVPLTADGAPVGILNLVGDDAEGAFSEDELRTFTSVGNQISAALERARLHEALERKVEERTRASQAEVAERRQAEAAAYRAEERLLDAIQSVSDGFALYDAEDRLKVCNSRYREIHANIADRIVPGAKFEDLVRAGLDANGPAATPSEEEVAARLTRHRFAEGKPLIARRAGCWLMLSERRTETGDVVVVETDITELKRADQAKDEFIATISHELRTPLTSIRAALAMLDAKMLGELNVAAAKMIEIAYRNCGSLLHIVEDLLDVAHISSGNLRLDLQTAALQPVLVRAVESVQASANAAGVEIAVENGAEDAVLEIDPFRITQVLSNLLSNAIKFSPPQSKIEIVAEKDAERIRVSVIDHGAGIPRDFQARAFEAFARADSSSTREKGGTGLGLSIAKTIIEAHRHGKIGFTSEEGVGTTFYFELPLLAEEQARGAA